MMEKDVGREIVLNPPITDGSSVNSNSSLHEESSDNVSDIRKRDFAFYLTYNELLDVNYVYDMVLSLCKSGIRYSILTRVCYINNTLDSYDITN